MDLTNVIEVKEISAEYNTYDARHEAFEKVTNMLHEGWILINTYTTCYDAVNAPNDLIENYVLGLTVEARDRQNNPQKDFDFNHA